MRGSWTLAAALLGLGAAPGGAQAQPPNPAPAHRDALSSPVDARWQKSLDAFAAADRAHPPAEGGVVFVGSSSIRLWSGLEAAFAGTPVIQRGFGGSRLSDCVRHVDQLVLPYRPRLVVLYAGDNDLWEGRSPQDVLASFEAFAQRVRADLPATRIAYVSIKPSPGRARMLPQAREANALISRYAARDPGIEFVDVYSKMVDGQGLPRRDLFLDDSVHLNRAGYAIWKAAIAQHLRRATPRPAR